MAHRERLVDMRFRATPAMADAIADEAERNKVSEAEVVRRSVEHWLWHGEEVREGIDGP